MRRGSCSVPWSYSQFYPPDRAALGRCGRSAFEARVFLSASRLRRLTKGRIRSPITRESTPCVSSYLRCKSLLDTALIEDADVGSLPIAGEAAVESLSGDRLRCPVRASSFAIFPKRLNEERQAAHHPDNAETRGTIAQSLRGMPLAEKPRCTDLDFVDAGQVLIATNGNHSGQP